MAIKVVVAEDNYLVREALIQLLETAPALELVSVAEDTDSLTRAIEQESPDVVLTDVFMPPFSGADGVHVAAHLRESHPEIGVVILSQYAEPGYAIELFESGSGGGRICSRSAWGIERSSWPRSRPWPRADRWSIRRSWTS